MSQIMTVGENLVIIFQEKDWGIVNGDISGRDVIVHIPCMTVKEFSPSACFPAARHDGSHCIFNLDYRCQTCNKDMPKKVKLKITKMMRLTYKKGSSY